MLAAARFRARQVMNTPTHDQANARVEALPLRPRAAPTVPVSYVGLGCNTFGGTVGPEDAAEIVAAALDARHHVF